MKSVELSSIVINMFGMLASWTAFFWTKNIVKNKRKQDFVDHWNKCRGYRENFWTPLRDLYKEFSNNKQNVPTSLENLIMAVRMPPNLPVKKGRLLYDWVKDNQVALNVDQRFMLDFVCSVYCPREEGSGKDRIGDVMDYSSIEISKRASFHTNRRKLTEFYETWPERLGVKYVRSSSQFKEIELYMLCWLDIALIQWTKDPGTGKEWMYKLGKD